MGVFDGHENGGEGERGGLRALVAEGVKRHGRVGCNNESKDLVGLAQRSHSRSAHGRPGFDSQHRRNYSDQGKIVDSAEIV